LIKLILKQKESLSDSLEEVRLAPDSLETDERQGVL